MSKLIFALLLIPTSALADGWHDPWTTGDTYREAAFVLVNGMDWAQTRYQARNPDRFIETNPPGNITPKLPQHPTTAQVDRKFTISMLEEFGFSYLLPAPYRAGFQYLNIGYEINIVHKNLQVGVKIAF